MSQKPKKIRRAAVIEMKAKSFTTGVLNNFSLFYGNVEFYNDGSEEVYEALKQYASKEMLKSAEMWTATFEYKEKEYGIMGDGEMTSSGSYILGKIEDEKFLKYEVYLKNKRWRLGYKNEKGVIEYTGYYSTKNDAQKAANYKNNKIANDDFKEEYFEFDKSIDIYNDYIDEYYMQEEGERDSAYLYRLKEESKKDSELKKLNKNKENKGKEYFSQIIYRDAYDYFSVSSSLLSSDEYLQIEDPSIIYNFGEYIPGEIKEFLSSIWEDDDEQKEELDKLIKEEANNALEDLGYKYLGKADVLNTEGYEVDNYGNMFYSDVYKKDEDE